jgi:hypothetical protein
MYGFKTIMTSSIGYKLPILILLIGFLGIFIILIVD